MSTPSSTDFVPVRLGTLRPGAPIDFDIYLAVAGRYIRHTLQSDALDKDRVAHLKSKGVKKVFISADAEARYLVYLDSGIETLTSSDVSTEQKSELAQASLIGLADSQATLESESTYQAAQGRVHKITDFLLSDRNHVGMFLKSSGVSRDVEQHSATVATLSLSLAERVGISDRKDLLELGLAALVHDIGKDASFDWSVKRATHSDAQSVALISHPAAGEEMLNKKAFVSKGIKDLVRDHEEIGEGMGFPSKKRLETLSKVQQVLNICNHLDMVCMDKEITPLDAGKQFFIEKIGLFKLDLMTALQEILAQRK